MSITRMWIMLCLRWSQLVFGEHYHRITPKIRAMRLLEEALELAQAEGVERVDAVAILNQVYAKPAGNPGQELGGVLVCVAAYAGTRHYDLDDAFIEEYSRILDPAIMAKVRKRNLEGDKLGMKE